MNEDIHAELKRLGNKQYAARLGKYFKSGKGGYGEGDKILGIQVFILRQMARSYQDISIDKALELIKSPFHEKRMLSLLILGQIFKRSNDIDKNRIFAASKQYKIYQQLGFSPGSPNA
jgi:hypothetical protein